MRLGQNVRKDEVKCDNFRINNKSNSRNKEYFVIGNTGETDSIMVISSDSRAKVSHSSFAIY